MTDRAAAVARRDELEDVHAPDALLAFLTIENDELAEPIRLVCDTLDHQIGADLYIAAMFGWQLLAEGDAPPRAVLTIPNVDRRIGQAIRATAGRIDVALDLRSSADFNLTVVPRLETAGAQPIYQVPQFRLVNVQADAVQVTGDLEIDDVTTLPYPSQRARQGTTPGLFR